MFPWPTCTAYLSRVPYCQLILITLLHFHHKHNIFFIHPWIISQNQLFFVCLGWEISAEQPCIHSTGQQQGRRAVQEQQCGRHQLDSRAATEAVHGNPGWCRQGDPEHCLWVHYRAVLPLYNSYYERYELLQWILLEAFCMDFRPYFSSFIVTFVYMRDVESI